MKALGSAGSGEEAVVEFSHLAKSFNGVKVLDDVNLRVAQGTVHGLVGENGSGKSTLIKILAGFHHPDPGTDLMVRGSPVQLPMRPSDPARLGLAFVHQDLGLVGSASVLENLFVGRYTTRAAWRIPWRAEARRAAALLRRYGLSTVDPLAATGQLNGAERAMLAVARAVSSLEDQTKTAYGKQVYGLVVVDEVTSFLSVDDAAKVLETLRQVAREGHSVLFVSHRLEEVFKLCDDVTVLRDGRVVAASTVAAMSQDELVSKMLNSSVLPGHEAVRRPAARASGGGSLLVVKEAGCDVFGALSFEIHPGEVLGLTGLAGSGFEMVPYALFGAVRAFGEMVVRGRRVSLAHLTPALAMRLGLGLVPADRLSQAAVGDGTLTENATMLLAHQLFRRGVLSPKAEKAEAARMISTFDVKPNRPEIALRYLSGGNQQKVIVAKWASCGAEVLFFHEPTRGVDVGAKQSILDTIQRLASDGRAILIASGDIGDLERVCERVLVMKRGKVVADFGIGQLSEASVLSALQGTALARTP